MTPILDLMFNLLIFFMLTTHFSPAQEIVVANMPRDVGPRISDRPDEERFVRIRLSLRGTSVELWQESALVGILSGEAVAACASSPGTRPGGNPRIEALGREVDALLYKELAFRLLGALSDPELRVILQADPQIPYDLVARCEDAVWRSARGVAGRRRMSSAVQIVYELQ